MHVVCVNGKGRIYIFSLAHWLLQKSHYQSGRGHLRSALIVQALVLPSTQSLQLSAFLLFQIPEILTLFVYWPLLSFELWSQNIWNVSRKGQKKVQELSSQQTFLARHVLNETEHSRLQIWLHRPNLRFQEFRCDRRRDQDHLSTRLPWIGCDPGLECDVWTQFSNSIRHTLPAQLLACLSASPDRLTPTNSGNFLHLGPLRGSTTTITGPDTIALNGILCSSQIGCTLWSGFSCRGIWCRTVVTHFGLDQLTGVTWQKSQDLDAQRAVLCKSINSDW